MTTPGYSSKCKACNSAHRADVDSRLLSGESARSVSDWLFATRTERITHQALLNHRNEHLDVRAEAAAQLAAIAPAYDAAVAKVVADAHVLDEVASLALHVARSLAPVIASSEGKPSMPAAVAFSGALSNARAAVMDRHEILHGKKLDITTTTTEDVSALHSRVAAALALGDGGADAGASGEADTGPTV